LFTWQVYVYIAAFILIGIFGMFIQYRFYIRDAKKKEEEVLVYNPKITTEGGEIQENETLDESNVSLIVKKAK